MFRAVLLFLALILGAPWLTTGRLSVTAPTPASELVAGLVPTLPGGVRSHVGPGTPDSGGTDGKGRSPGRRVGPGFASLIDPVVPAVRILAAGEAAAHSVNAAFLAHALAQVLARADLLASPSTAPPAGSLV